MLYIIGFTAVLLFVMFSVDDLFWDVAHIFRFTNPETSTRIRVEELDQTMPRLLAVVMAAWQENNIIWDVVNNLIETTQYPTSMYQIFLGVYVNDRKTLAIAQELARCYENVQVVVNPKAGPTTKGDNINNILKRINEFEQERGWKFKAFVIHDSEDVVHPYEFKLANHLLDKYDAVQFPVFPLQPMPSWKNIFSNMTVGTYADEFADNHFHSLLARKRSGAFLPSLGTGFALGRKVVEDHGFKHVFPRENLKAGYKLALDLSQKGYKVHFVHETVDRLNDNGRIVAEFVSTRSRFPESFQAAVRQKTRWIFGTTMQSLSWRTIVAGKDLNLVQRYSLYKDWKAKFANLTYWIGYAIILYLLLSNIIPLPLLYPRGSLAWNLCGLATVIILERQLFRGWAVKKVYGWRSLAVACLLPPIVPVRMVWGYVINLSATVRAWQMYFYHGLILKDDIRGSAPPWDKTEHEFLDKATLKRYHRKLGDAVLAKKLISAQELRKSLIEARTQGKRLGAVLKENRLMSEVDLLTALSQLQHTIYLPLTTLRLPDHSISFGWDVLEKVQAVPLLRKGNTWAVAISDESLDDARDLLERACGGRVYLVYSTVADIKVSLLRMKITLMMPETAPWSILQQRLDQGQVNFEQVLLAIKYAAKKSQPIESVLADMGMEKGRESMGPISTEVQNEYPLDYRLYNDLSFGVPS